MKLSTLFVANSVFALIGSLSLLLAPLLTFESYGSSLNPDGMFVAHILGVTVLGVAVLSYAAKNITDRTALNWIMVSFIIAHVGSAILATAAAANGLFNSMIWVDVIAHGAFALGFGYYLIKK